MLSQDEFLILLLQRPEEIETEHLPLQLHRQLGHSQDGLPCARHRDEAGVVAEPGALHAGGLLQRGVGQTGP